MSDPVSTPAAPAPPIEVHAELGTQAAWQTGRVVILFICGAVFARLFHSETVIAAGMTAAAAVLTYGYGLVKLWRQHIELVRLVDLLPDELARLK
jgi:hypothetical protein